MIGQTIAHYRVTAKLGAGGMGEVYRAHDEQLDRDVALKVLPAESFSDGTARARLLREARAAASLNHPNICTIHEVGEVEGRAYIAMELVDGQPLSTRLTAGGLPAELVLRYGGQIADALSHAHERQIVHRDLKSANVVITGDGRAKVLDFGLAKRLSEGELDEATRSQASLTVPGALVGTLAYIAPEQLRGQPADARSDVWALGVVLYEMATGARPFQGQTGFALSSAILNQSPPALPAKVPVELRAVIERCLDKEPSRRYQRASEVRAALEAIHAGAVAPWAGWRYTFARRRWLVVAAALAVLAIAGASLNTGGLRSRLAGSAAGPKIESLAVLPLENLSGDPTQEYFADGMTEALISNLAQIRALSRVISRTSVMRYKGSRKSLPEIAQELNVDAVIEGTVQRSGGRVRVTAKLIPAATDSPLWAGNYERDLGDVLKLQSDVARAVADEIRLQVTPEERARLASARNINPQAHDAYLLGRHHLRTNEEDLRQAIGHFERAVQLGPDYAAAYAGLSRAWTMRGVWGAKNRKEVAPFARDAAVQAVALDPQLAEAHVELSDIKLYDFDWAGAEQEITRALVLGPNSARAHQAYADLLMVLERHAEAIREIARAEQLDPLSSHIQSRYGRVLYRARKYEEALPYLQRAIELDPNPGNSMPYWILGEIYVQMGRYHEAIASLKKAQAHGGRALDLSAEIAGVYAHMGKPKEARRMLAELKATTDPASFSNTSVVHAYTALGNKDEAFKVLFRLVEERNNVAATIKADPPFESLHSDPRWKELLRRMNLPH